MSKHRLREDDETTLLPRAVEEPAAAEPVAEDHPERPSRRAPVVIAVVTTGLLLSGAAAWALAKPAPNAPTVALPEILASTPGAGFVDGFGVVTPSPTHLASLAPAQPPASPTATSGASASAGPSPAVPSPSRTTVGAPPGAPPPGGAPVAGVYDADTWPGGYVVSVQVRNTGSEPLQWTVRIQLPAGATVTGDWEADRATQDGWWVFTPDRGPLAPGATYVFGFIGQRGSGADFKVTCTVNGTVCQAA
ncbi:cellulose binding domain-containing protein [Catellatospora bangladeshensis]|uniref:cellulose binding domain-containing protein n=1 Tax=Catellatospora bangladeshensis TaxID=310355 RepID=UPI0019434A95|nr:cellulose binding domain-containing protein [Catellatospora bangladeshensis]